MQEILAGCHIFNGANFVADYNHMPQTLSALHCNYCRSQTFTFRRYSNCAGFSVYGSQNQHCLAVEQL